MAAYRTAARMFKGYHVPLLYIGMQYLRTYNIQLAETSLLKTLEICTTDPLVYNELGVVSYRQGRWDEAIRYFETALSQVPDDAVVRKQWEPTLFNLGHCFRKTRRYDEALVRYHEALMLVPKESTLYAAIGFTLQLQGKVHKAVDYYHKALSLSSMDGFVAKMLTMAIEGLA